METFLHSDGTNQLESAYDERFIKSTKCLLLRLRVSFALMIPHKSSIIQIPSPKPREAPKCQKSVRNNKRRRAVIISDIQLTSEQTERPSNERKYQHRSARWRHENGESRVTDFCVAFEDNNLCAPRCWINTFASLCLCIRRSRINLCFAAT